MLKVLFTLDYEIHGNGDGDPYALMVEPTGRLIDLFDRYGAKLTIMADIGEILKFKEHKETTGRDDFSYDQIAEQLRSAIRRGHDVQLHIHSSYFNARREGRRWVQDWSEYDFASLNIDRMREVVRVGKEYLEKLLRPVRSNYRCVAFRAANWSVNPSSKVVKALVENEIKIDTSVFKFGRRNGIVNFDYTDAWSAIVPWKVKEDEICARDENGKLFEFPIYAERRWLGAFLTPQRVFRAALGRLHRVSQGPIGNNGHGVAPAARFFEWHYPWKADFNQCGGRQLIGALERADAEFGAAAAELPFVLIGHSKLFTRFNGWSLKPFLAHVAASPSRFGFASFGDFDLDRFETASPSRDSEVLKGSPSPDVHCSQGSS